MIDLIVQSLSHSVFCMVIPDPMAPSVLRVERIPLDFYCKGLLLLLNGTSKMPVKPNKQRGDNVVGDRTQSALA